MSEATSADLLETERLDPDQLLVRRRQERDEQEYRSRCESVYGTVQVGPERFHPADVFDKLAPDAARRGRDDALSQARTELEEAVCDEFPAPIAIPFQAFLEGSSAALTRLHRLRDAWESLVRLLAALALSEAAGIGSSFSPLRFREGKDQTSRVCKLRDLSSERLSVRIGLIEGVLDRAEELALDLQISSLLPGDVLAEIRRLNVVRNGFSGSV